MYKIPSLMTWILHTYMCIVFMCHVLVFAKTLHRIKMHFPSFFRFIITAWSPTSSSTITQIKIKGIGAVVGITAVVTGTVLLPIGFVAGVLLHYCNSKHPSHQTSKSDPSSHQQQKAVSASDPLQQTSPEYKEVVELRRKRSRPNISKHQSQSSQPESPTYQQQQTSAEYEKPMPAPN